MMPLSFAGTIDPNNNDNQYISYAEEFDCVGLLIGKKQDDTPYSGSAVAYKPNVVITAAHLFHKSKQSGVIFGQKFFVIKDIILHNDYDYNKFGKYDIAICILSTNTDLKWYPDIYDQNNEKNKLCSISGFGSTGTFLSGVVKSDGKRRAGLNTVDRTNDFVIFCSPSVLHMNTKLEFLISPGDSGGGLFIDNKLAGIHSGVIEDKPNAGKSKYGAVSVHTRLSRSKQWIDETIKNYEK